MTSTTSPEDSFEFENCNRPISVFASSNSSSSSFRLINDSNQYQYSPPPPLPIQYLVQEPSCFATYDSNQPLILSNMPNSPMAIPYIEQQLSSLYSPEVYQLTTESTTFLYASQNGGYSTEMIVHDNIIPLTNSTTVPILPSSVQNQESTFVPDFKSSVNKNLNPPILKNSTIEKPNRKRLVKKSSINKLNHNLKQNLKISNTKESKIITKKPEPLQIIHTKQNSFSALDTPEVLSPKSNALPYNSNIEPNLKPNLKLDLKPTPEPNMQIKREPKPILQVTSPDFSTDEEDPEEIDDDEEYFDNDEKADKQVKEQGSKTAKGHRRRRLLPRSKAGCWVCRIKHLKCDEAKPSCANCNRFSLNDHCDYSPQKPGYIVDKTLRAAKLAELTAIRKKMHPRTKRK